MNCAWKKVDPKAEQFRFYADRCISSLFVSRCSVCRWTDGFRTGKVILKNGHRQGRSVLVRNKQTVLFVKKLIEENLRIIICEICEGCDVSVGTAARIVRDDINLKKKKKKVVAKWIPHLLTDQQKKQLNVQMNCSTYLNQMDQNAFAASSQVIKPGCKFMVSLTNGPIRCGWLLTGGDQLCFDPTPRIGSDCFPFFSNT